MDEVEIFNKIKAALKYKEPELELLNFAKCDDEIYYRLNQIAKSLCSEMIPEDSTFYLVDSPKKDAVVIHELSAVVMFRGMLDFIFRMASLVAAVAQCSTAVPVGALQPWAGHVGFWLQEGPFFFDNEQYWWLRSPDRRDIFDNYVSNFFRFVVLHEIGHLHNMHAARRKDVRSPNPAATTENAGDFDENFSIHVREIVADTFAFQFLWEKIAEHLSDKSLGSDFGWNMEVALKAAGFNAALEVVQLYFWLSASMPATRAVFALDPKKYPPQAFRMQAVESTALEHADRVLPSGLAPMLVEQAMMQTYTISKDLAGVENFIRWRLNLNDPVFQEHYAKICHRVPGWANTEFGRRDYVYSRPLHSGTHGKIKILRRRARHRDTA